MENFNPHKLLILNCYKYLFKEGDITYANKVIKSNYIQHSPTVKDGKAGFLEFLAFLKQIPKQGNPPKPFMRLICDEEFVAVHLSIEFMGQKNAVVDLFRIENQQLAEHWDAVQNISHLNKTSVGIVEGTVLIEDINLTKKNKATIAKYAKEVLMKKEKKNFANFVSDKLVQHNPDIDKGITGLMNFYKDFEITKIHRIIGEGNFVLTQSEGALKQLPYVRYDIYRLKDTLIHEHWSVKQMVPEKMAHNNGMI